LKNEVWVFPVATVWPCSSSKHQEMKMAANPDPDTLFANTMYPDASGTAVPEAYGTVPGDEPIATGDPILYPFSTISPDGIW
jgi:hypothetical protein